MSIVSTRAHDNPLHLFMRPHAYTKLPHRIGDVVFLPEEICTDWPDNYTSGGFAPTSEGYFYNVVARTTDRHGRTCCTLRHLTPLKGKPKMTADHIDDTFHRVTGYTAALTLDTTTET